jgi:hypothetical protein
MAGPVTSAELRPQAVADYEAYVMAARESFRVRAHTDAGRSAGHPVGSAASGRTSAQGRIVRVSGGLVHHWKAATFVRDVTLDQVLAVAQAYDDCPTIHRAVRSSRLLGRAGNVFGVASRLQGGAGPVTAILDVWSVITYERSARCAQSFGVASEIPEVDNGYL